MNTKILHPRSLALGAALFLSLPAMTQAQESPAVLPTTSGSEWSFSSTIYGWGQWIEGTIGVRGILADTYIGFDEVFKNLDFAFMGTIEARHGKFALVADMTYAELSAENQTPHGLLFSDFELKQKQFIGNFVGAYTLLNEDRQFLDVYAGVRVNYLEMELNLSAGLLPARSAGGSETWVDPIIGLRYRADLGSNYYFQAAGDIGGFGLASDFTWQVLVGVGYQVNENVSLAAGFRALGTDYEDDGFTYDVIAYGPILGMQIRF